VHRQIPEADWKRFRQLQPLALERFCQRVLEEVARLAADASRSSHKRYGEIYGLILERDEELALSFDNPRRSTAMIQLARIRAGGLLTEDEFIQFSPETRAAVEWLVQAWRA
jgi:hypothetical protein